MVASASWARTTVASAGARTAWPNPGKSDGRRARGHQARPGRRPPAGSVDRVDGVGLAVGVEVVAGHPVGRADLVDESFAAMAGLTG